LACALFYLSFFVYVVRIYQRSFFPEQAPSYPGVSSENPFICGKTLADPQTYDGESVLQRLLARIEANPYASTPEYGLLALSSGERAWAETFRESLLQEARQAAFTTPANSVKSVQFEAALRAYFYPRILSVFPNLFSSDEQADVHQWFTEINRRALTVEWVDWMYGLAFSKLPEGPYENQENGAGLLALLESNGLTIPSLSLRNADYLARNPRGWAERFRVTDDAVKYQPEWIDNAFFQSLYTGEVDITNRRLSFEWLLLQALPDGAPLIYNHVAGVSMDGIAYLGATLLNDGKYVWLSGRALDYGQAHETYTFAQPGLESAINLAGESPIQGSCLIYGNSGLPNQAGPLAPDKIVLRNGWSTDSSYALLDLRFAGWHRYKATNAISLVYQEGPLVAEKLSGEVFSWLPKGRSLFRDKRVPRENLNGLVVPRNGMSAVLFTLTGIGGPWAQDPPYYATVEDFKTGPELDTSTTVISDWRGWSHWRTINLYHAGPIVVVDKADGSTISPAALIWHIPVEDVRVQGQRIRVRDGNDPAEIVLVPIAGTIQMEEDDPGLKIQVENSGTLSLVTVFLTGDWVGSSVNLNEGQLSINGPTQLEIQIPK
jgi:hypothetical protein